jgi:hypothetical protein
MQEPPEREDTRSAAVTNNFSWMVLLSLLLSVAPYSQGGKDRVPPLKFLVHGKINAPPGAEVTFRNEALKATVKTSRNGSYEVKLPLGVYTMSVRHPQYPLLQEFRRPIFRVTSAKELTLNATLLPGRTSCDTGVLWRPGSPPPSLEQQLETRKNACGYFDLFDLRAKDETPFQLYIRYPRRSSVNGNYIYAGDWVATNLEVPVLAEYNLFTLTADRVTFDAKQHILSAVGRVVTIDESGLEMHSESSSFKIEDGQAIPVQQTTAQGQNN